MLEKQRILVEAAKELSAEAATLLEEMRASHLAPGRASRRKERPASPGGPAPEADARVESKNEPGQAASRP